eukprot:1160114-Pelagomonas_calceolata.AAC.24
MTSLPSFPCTQLLRGKSRQKHPTLEQEHFLAVSSCHHFLAVISLHTAAEGQEHPGLGAGAPPVHYSGPARALGIAEAIQAWEGNGIRAGAGGYAVSPDLAHGSHLLTHNRGCGECQECGNGGYHSTEDG